MKSFNGYLSMHLGAFLFASVFTVAFGLWASGTSLGPTASGNIVSGAMCVNIAFFLGRAYNSFSIDRNAIEDRIRWEESMLRAIQLAKEADNYYYGEANTISAFHSAVAAKEQEGIRKGYLDVGRL